MYDCMKVNLFVDHISDPLLDAAKHQVLSNEEKYGEDFDSVVQFLVMALNRRKASAKATRNVSGVSQGNKQSKGRLSPKAFTGEISGTKTYTKKEWAKLSKGQKEEVHRLRKLAQGGKKASGDGGSGGKRQAAAANSNGTRASSEETEESDSESEENPDAPFGRRAHKGKKSKREGLS
jgi:nanoRNase/pAp phosphatase (c-di-AMP/oligoRNAs hydrolase)